MIHDLDVLLAAIGTEVTAIEAVGVPVLSPRIDIANVRLTFASGCIANLTASRISFDTIRKMRFFQPRAYIGIDFAKKEAELYQVVVGATGIDGGKLAVRHRAASSSWRTSSTPCGRSGRRGSAARTAAARWSWRIASRPSWPEESSREAIPSDGSDARRHRRQAR